MRLTFVALCFCVLFCVAEINVVKPKPTLPPSLPPRHLLQNIVITNPIIGFDLVCTLGVQKKCRKKTSRCDWRRKTFSNYSARSLTSCNLCAWWLHTFLYGFLCCQPFLCDLLHFAPLHIYNGSTACTLKSLYIPHICSSRLTAGITIHHVCKEPEKLSPYFTIEACQ